MRLMSVTVSIGGMLITALLLGIVSGKCTSIFHNHQIIVGLVLDNLSQAPVA